MTDDNQADDADELNVDDIEELDVSLLESESGVIAVDVGGKQDAAAVAAEAARLLRARDPQYGAALLQLLDQEIAASEGDAGVAPAELAALHTERAHLLEFWRDDVEGALSAYANAFGIDPTHVPAAEALERIFFARQAFPNLQKLFEAELRFARTDADRVRINVELGLLHEGPLTAPAVAESHYRAALALDGNALGALLGLTRLSANRNASDLRDCYERLAALVSDPALKVAYLVQVAHEQEKAGALDDVFVTLATALGLGVNEGAVLDEMERVARAHELNLELLRALETKFQYERGLPAPDLALLKQLRREQAQVSPPADGLALLRDALTLAPDDRLLIDEALRLAYAARDFAAALALLVAREPLLGAAEQHSSQLERAHLLRKLGDGPSASALEKSVAQAAPLHPWLVASQLALHEANPDAEPSDYIAACEREALLAQSKGDKLWEHAAWLKAGWLLYERGELERSIEYAQRALALDRDSLSAQWLLGQLYRRAEKHRERAELLRGAIARQPARKILERLYEQLLVLQEYELRDLPAAYKVLKEYIATRPDDVRLRFRALELGKRLGRPGDIIADLNALLPLVSEEVRADLLLAQAQLLDRLDERDRAHELYRDALKLRPSEVRAARALQGYSQRSQRTDDSGAIPLSLKAWDDIIEALGREAATASGQKRIAQLFQMALIHERERKDLPEALHAFEQIVAEAPDNVAALRNQARIASLLGKHDEAASAVQKRVARLRGDASTQSTFVQLAELREKLGEFDLAEETFDKANAILATAHATLGATVASARRKDHAAEANRTAALLAYAETPAMQALVHDVHGALTLSFGDLGTSARALSQSLAIEPARLSSRLLQVYAHAHEHKLKDAVIALADGVAAFTQPAWRSGLHRLRAFYGEERADFRLTHLLEAIVADGSQELYVDASELLCAPELAQLAHARPELLVAAATALRTRADATSGNDRAEWLVRLGTLWLEAGRANEASAAAETAIALAPESLPALELRLRIAETAGTLANRAEAAHHFAVAVKEPSLACELYRLCGAYYESADQPLDAAAAYRAALEHVPTDDEAFAHARELLAKHYHAAKDPGPLHELYTHRLAHVTDTNDRTALHLDRAQIARDQKDDRGAAADLRAVLKLWPEHPTAMVQLAQLLAQVEPGLLEAAELYRRYAVLEEDPAARRQALLDQAAVEERLDHIENAVACLTAAQTLSTQLIVEKKRTDLLLRLNQNEQGLEALRRSVELSRDAHEQSELQLSIADVEWHRRRRAPAAFVAITAAIALQPKSRVALGLLRDLKTAKQIAPAELEAALTSVERALRDDIAHDNADVTTYELLTECFALRGWQDSERLARDAARVLVTGAVPALTEAALARRPLGSLGWSWLVQPVSQPLLKWYEVLEPILRLARGLTKDELGVARSRKATVAKASEEYADALQLAQLAGFNVDKLYLIPGSEAVYADKDQTVIGSLAARTATAPQALRVLGAFVFARAQIPALYGVTEKELVALFTAAGLVAGLTPRFMEQLGASADTATMDKFSRAVDKELGRSGRAKLRELEPTLGALARPAELAKMLDELAGRASLLVLGDLAPLGAALHSTEARAKWAKESVDAQLLQFRRSK